MVTREYKCKDCGIVIGEEVSVHEEVKRECPKCGGTLAMQFGLNDSYLFNSPRCGAISNRFKASRHG